MMNGQHLYRKKVSKSITLRFDKAILDELRSESESNMECQYTSKSDSKVIY